MSIRTQRTRARTNRIRTTSLLAAVPLVAAATLLPTPGAQAAENCRGTPATIVDTGGSGPLIGTEGNDVIVTHGRFVEALGGNDLVCGDGSQVGVAAGAGDDVVDLKAVKGSTRVELGAGADTFEGGNASDTVYGAFDQAPITSGVPGTEPDDVDADVISTGSDLDRVTSGSGSAVNHDRVDTGEGNDVVTIVPTASDGALSLGPGANKLQLELSSTTSEDWAVDTGQHEVTHSAGVMVWQGEVAKYVVDSDATAPHSQLSFRGSAAGEKVVFADQTTNLQATVRLRAGDDKLMVRNRTADGSAYALGRNQDTLILNPSITGSGFLNHTVRVRLDQHRIDYGTTAPAAAVTSVERLRASGTVVRAWGDFKAEDIRVTGCAVHVRAGVGPDFVKRSPVGLDACQGVQTRLAGGPGNDRLVGTAVTGDRLIGGRGPSDFANGRGGADVCRAEIVRNCG